MKRGILISLLLLFKVIQPRAQVPEKIYGKNRVLQTNDYYLEQMVLWGKVVEREPQNADAWYNLYRANRNAYVVGEEQDGIAAKGVNRFERLNNIVLAMEKNVPESFECNYAKWLNGNNDPTLFPFLEKAHAINPIRSEPLMDLMYYHEVNGNYALRDSCGKEAYNLGEFSPGLLNYGYNALAGLEKSAIIFTEGDKDIDAIFLLQSGKKIRTDVRLVNLNLLLNQTYRERIFSELGLSPFDIDPFSGDEQFEKYRQAIIEHFAHNTDGRPVYVSVTVTNPYKIAINKKLYLTGLTYLYSETPKDEIALIKKNYEEAYALDYLTVYLPADISIGMLHRFNKNYFLSLSALCNYFKRQGKLSTADYYRSIAHKIAEDDGSMVEFDSLFSAE